MSSAGELAEGLSSRDIHGVVLFLFQNKAGAGHAVVGPFRMDGVPGIHPVSGNLVVCRELRNIQAIENDIIAFQISGLGPDNPLAGQKSLHRGFAVVECRPLHRAREFVARDAFNRKPYGNAVVYIVRKLIESSEPFPFDILHPVTFRRVYD